MLVAAALAIALLPQEPAEVVLRTHRWADREVRAVLPAASRFPQSSRYIDFQGRRYLFDGGELAGVVRTDGDWGELRQLHQAASSADVQPIPWRTKFVLFVRSDVIDRSAEGVIRQRRSAANREETDRALGELALFAEMVFAYTEGRVRIDAQVEIENDAFLFDATREVPFGEEFARSYFTPRINGPGFEAEDRIYRGPYHSVLFLHWGLAGGSPLTEVNGNPVTGLAFNDVWRRHQSGNLARHLFNAWVQQAVFQARRQGYLIPPDPSPLAAVHAARPLPLLDPAALIRDDMWPMVSNLTDTRGYGDRLPGVEAQRAEAIRWSDITGAPWSDLPQLDLGKIRYFDEATRRHEVGGRTYWLVRPEFAEFVAAHLSAARGATLAGFADAEGQPVIVFHVASPPGLAADTADWLDLPHFNEVEAVVDPNEDPFTVSRAAQVHPVGAYVVEDVKDESRGDVLEVAERSLVRHGWLRLLGRTDGRSFADLQERPYLTFWVKSSSSEPSEIWIEGEGWSATIPIFGALDVPTELAADGTAENRMRASIHVPADGQWRQVAVDLREAAARSGSNRIKGIYLRPDAFAARWEQLDPHNPVYRFDDIALTSETPPVPLSKLEMRTPIVANAESEVVVERAAAAAQAAASGNRALLRTLLNESEELVRLNAVWPMQEQPDPEAQARLVELSANINLRVAQAAANALGALRTDAAWEALRRAAESGPFEYNRQYAVLNLALADELRLIGPISSTVNGRSWMTRLAGARALNQMTQQMARIILLSTFYLEDINPGVRYFVVSNAAEPREMVMQRLMFPAVNDPSDAVRAAAAVRLLGAEQKAPAAEGFRAVRDDGLIVRLAVVEALAGIPGEQARNALRLAVTDLTPEVRAAALLALSKHAGEVQMAEVQNVLADTDPRVLRALAKLAGAKALTLPSQTLDNMRASRDQEVREAAKSVGQ
jgi:HEAT repeat protein